MPRVNVSQYDKGARTLEISLYNGSVPFSIPNGATVSIQGTKADDTGFQYAATFSGSVVTADVTDQMTVFAGDVETEVVIAASGQQLASGNFVLRVEPAALSDDAQISETDIPVLQSLPERLARLEQIAQTIEAPTYNAETETIIYPVYP